MIHFCVHCRRALEAAALHDELVRARGLHPSVSEDADGILIELGLWGSIRALRSDGTRSSAGGAPYRDAAQAPSIVYAISAQPSASPFACAVGLAIASVAAGELHSEDGARVDETEIARTALSGPVLTSAREARAALDAMSAVDVATLESLALFVRSF